MSEEQREFQASGPQVPRASAPDPTTGSSGANIRVGLRFEQVSSTAQAALDRVVYALMRRKAQARRPLTADASVPAAAAERRLTPRVELVGQAESVTAELIPAARGALAPRAAGVQRFHVADISTTGCGLAATTPAPFQPQQRVRLRLVGSELDVELQARVMHVQPVGTSAG